MLRDVQTFVAAFDTLFGGFRQRAQKTYADAAGDGTAFLVVASPEPDALREAAFFVERLAGADAAGRAGGQPGHPVPRGSRPSRRWPRPSGSTSEAAADGRGRDRAHRRAAPAARGAARHVPGSAAAPAVRGGAPAGADGRRAGTGHGRARPRRPAPGRRAALPQVMTGAGRSPGLRSAAAQAGTSSGGVRAETRPRGRPSLSRAGGATR